VLEIVVRCGGVGFLVRSVAPVGNDHFDAASARRDEREKDMRVFFELRLKVARAGATEVVEVE